MTDPPSRPYAGRTRAGGRTPTVAILFFALAFIEFPLSASDLAPTFTAAVVVSVFVASSLALAAFPSS